MKKKIKQLPKERLKVAVKSSSPSPGTALHLQKDKADYLPYFVELWSKFDPCACSSGLERRRGRRDGRFL